MSEEREISQQQVQDFLVREFGFFLWLSEALVEDEALHRLLETDDNTGPTLVPPEFVLFSSFFVIFL